jgi:hypothetical protein
MSIYIIILILVILIALLIVTAGKFDNLLDMKMQLMPKPIYGGSSKRYRKTNSILKTKDLAKHPRTKSEARAVEILSTIVGCDLPTAYPKWLVWKGKSLELDGYNEQKKIAIEFSGPLHTKWYSAKEPYEDYFERITRDVVKRKLCAKNNVLLITIDMSLPTHHWRNYMLSRLYDAHWIDPTNPLIEDMPSGYIAEQNVQPFRNPQIERELGLESEMARAEKL